LVLWLLVEVVGVDKMQLVLQYNDSKLTATLAPHVRTQGRTDFFDWRGPNFETPIPLPIPWLFYISLYPTQHCVETVIVDYYTVFQKNGVEIFAITLSTVNRFWNFFHCWKQQYIICKINIILFSPFLINLALLPCETQKFKNVATALPLRDDRAANSTIFHFLNT